MTIYHHLTPITIILTFCLALPNVFGSVLRLVTDEEKSKAPQAKTAATDTSAQKECERTQNQTYPTDVGLLQDGHSHTKNNTQA